MSIDQSGAFDYHIQHPSKTPAHRSIKKKKKNPCPNKPKDGIQRHYKSTNPITRTFAKIITDVRRRPTKPKPRKEIVLVVFSSPINNQP